MALCDLHPDNPGFVVATYTLAIFPWSLVAVWDPITAQWNSFWYVLLQSVAYLVVSVLPYLLLVPYAVLQACSSHERDLKELMTTLVAMLVSVWNMRRALRGLLALYNVHLIWKSADVEAVYVGFYYYLMPHFKPLPETRKLKCSVWNLLVSSRIADNDLPGDAPRVHYFSALFWALWESSVGGFSRRHHGDGSGELDFSSRLSKLFWKKGYASDEDDRECIVSIWLLWMIRRSVMFMSSESMRPTYFEKYAWRREKAEPFIRDGEHCSWLHRWTWKREFARANQETLRTQHNQPLSEIFILRAIFSAGRARAIPGLANIDLGKFEMHKHLSGLPTKVEQVLSLSTTMLLVLMRTYLALKIGKVNIGEMMCKALGVSTEYAFEFCTWLRTKREISTEPRSCSSSALGNDCSTSSSQDAAGIMECKEKALAFIAILARYPRKFYYYRYDTRGASTSHATDDLRSIEVLMRVIGRLSRDEEHSFTSLLTGMMRTGCSPEDLEVVRSLVDPEKGKLSLSSEIFLNLFGVNDCSKLIDSTKKSLESLHAVFEKSRARELPHLFC